MIYALLALLALLQVADVLTTARVLKNGGRELNPLMRFVIDKTGFVGLLVVKLLAVAGIAALLLMFYPQWWVAAVLCAVYAAVVVHNWRQAKKD